MVYTQVELAVLRTLLWEIQQQAHSVVYVNSRGDAWFALDIISPAYRWRTLICYRSNRSRRPIPWLRQFASAHAVAGLSVTIH